MAALRPAGDFDRTYEQDMAVVRRPWQWVAVAVGLLLVATVPLWGTAYMTITANQIFYTIIAVQGLNVLTGYTGHPPHRGISKTALGAEETVPWQHTWDPMPLFSDLRTAGHEIAVLETSTRAVDLYDWRPRFPVAIVFGNEVDGVSSEIAELADVHVRIPMLGLKQSLNVAVAGGVVLFELLRKYRALHENSL